MDIAKKIEQYISLDVHEAHHSPEDIFLQSCVYMGNEDYSELKIDAFLENFCLHLQKNGIFIKYSNVGNPYAYIDGRYVPLTNHILKKGLYTYANTGKYSSKIKSPSNISEACNRLSLSSEIFTKKQPKNSVVRINMNSFTLSIHTNKNGHTVKKKPHDPNDNFMYKLSYDYDDTADCPQFKAFLDKVLPDKDLQEMVLEYVAYCLLPELNFEKVLVLLGSGSNGKSVFFNIIRALLGEDNVTSYSLKSLCDDNGYTRAKLEGKLLNYGSEMALSVSNPEYLKKLVSGEPIEARLPYKEPEIITQYARLMFNANELPSSNENTNAYFRRFLICPFKVRIKDAEKDPNLAQKIIKNELAGIFNLVLSKIPKLLKSNGFTEPKAVKTALKKYETDNNNALYFIKTEGYKKSQTTAEKASDVYSQYKIFCINYGFKPSSYRQFLKNLKRKFKIVRRGDGYCIYIEKKQDF